MAFGFTNANGSFFLEGHETEITNIDPVLKIFHKCNDKGIPCERTWRIGVPDKYITIGEREPKKVMDVGILNVEVVLNGETRDCIH
ncbi:unnamed protein product [Toxocara canis]|uniref:Transthyretin-like protein 46 n=1 Tax=Toxocara canis TaxID=6265 RepID=A0A3P7FLD5_TOXCA|nr:unnamed protein product [Toxocara canis]